MNNIIDSQIILKIYNTIRSLGLNTSLKGTKFLNKVIQIIISSDNEFYCLENIYSQLTIYFPEYSSTQIRNYIKYALDNRNISLCQKNFEKIFGFEYDEYLFVNKTIIEEILNDIQLESI